VRDYLWDRHRIITVSINHAEFRGLRISPSVYTTIPELDRFIDVMSGIARNGLSA
jgi:selenocysteine lyase/cysteine desulfurase